MAKPERVARDHSVNAAPINLVRPGKFYTGKGALIEADFRTFGRFFDLVRESIAKCEVTEGSERNRYPLEPTLERLQRQFRSEHHRGARVIFVGNGGSAAIASHCAIDWTKNGGIRAIAFNDAAALTCWGNDAGYDQVFAKQIEHHATPRDSVVIVSSSGKSPNVLAAADAARVRGCARVVTLTGRNPNNVLRAKGDVNLYVPAADYGLVEMAHMAILHSVVSVRG